MSLKSLIKKYSSKFHNNRDITLPEDECNLHLSDMTPKVLANIENGMRPGKGKMSDVGFLQDDQKLKDVIKNDKRFLKSYNLTFDNVAECLEKIYDCLNNAKHGDDYGHDNKWIKYDTNISVAFHDMQTMGYQSCPFVKKHKSYNDKGEMFTIRNDNTHDEINLNYLHIHMIKRHHFCEGPGTPYRFDLETAIRVLELA